MKRIGDFLKPRSKVEKIPEKQKLMDLGKDFEESIIAEIKADEGLVKLPPEIKTEDKAEGWYSVGVRAEFKSKNPNQAEDSYKRAIYYELKKEKPDPEKLREYYHSLGRTLTTLGKDLETKSKTLVDRIGPFHTILHTYETFETKSDYWRVKRIYEKAEESFIRAMAYNPESLRIHRDFVETLLKQSDLAEDEEYGSTAEIRKIMRKLERESEISNVLVSEEDPNKKEKALEIYFKRLNKEL